MASNVEEPMDCDSQDKLPLPNQGDPSANDEDVAELKVSVWSPEEFDPKKFRREITKTLQTWASKNGIRGEFTATKISDDGKTAVISVKPAAALQELLNISGQKLNTREKKTFSLTPIKAEEQSQEDMKSSGEYSSLKPQKAHNGSVDLGKKDSPADDDSDKTLVALSPYWYMKNIHRDDIERIEKQNGVRITENVEVSINGDKKNGADPKKASDEFIELVQSCLNISNGLSIPLKEISPEGWKDILKFIQSTEHKCQITISSDQVTIFGSQQYQTAIMKSLKCTKISTNLTDEERMDDFSITQGATSPSSYNEDRRNASRNRIKITSSIKDPFVMDGLQVEEYYWKLLKNQYQKELHRIKEKFNVRFKDADTTPGQKVIKVSYNRSEGNMQMESHAMRALLRLYQKVATSQFLKNNGTFHDVDGDDEDLYSSPDKPKGATGKNYTPEEKSSTSGLAEGGAAKKQSAAEAKKDEKDDMCPVCLDHFTKKTQLRCKHEFCEECLEQSVKSQGPVCPVCKDVFGLVEGDQPNGTMTWMTRSSRLPGYERCGTIEIQYNIPSGTQTAKHPSPGRMYSGLCRTAFLPDNPEGNEVLKLLKRAFDQKLIFTVGMSRTTGANNVVTWNDIHHKTSISGGPECFGYPDPHYLSRVKEELKAKGIK